ncbi:MAG: cold shock domain-containing protein [Candidatus Heimdallarchaeota archaeon]|nr:cold shock domain-containing protein [Candidatus Heimdallarchaeota archaeon]
MKGIIKKIFRNKGFGFIKTEKGKEIYFNDDELTIGLTIDSLSINDKVRFFIEENDRGEYASCIILA